MQQKSPFGSRLFFLVHNSRIMHQSRESESPPVFELRPQRWGPNIRHVARATRQSLKKGSFLKPVQRDCRILVVGRGRVPRGPLLLVCCGQKTTSPPSPLPFLSVPSAGRFFCWLGQMPSFFDQQASIFRGMSGEALIMARQWSSERRLPWFMEPTGAAQRHAHLRPTRR
jgi:hypothetical protein